MRFIILSCLFAILFAACSQKNKQSNSKKSQADTAYIITKDGIGSLKIGITQQEVEALLGQKLSFRHAQDTQEVWADTASARYKEIDVTLYFDKYGGEEENSVFHLAGVETSSPLCSTENGLSIGAEKKDILAAYDDSPVDMGPQYEPVNDSTWLPSKTKFYINIKDDKWDKVIVFHLVDKKVVSLEATAFMGE